MYYKVIKDGKTIDILDKLTFVKYQPKHDILLLCDEKDAQAIMSSDGKSAYHLCSLNPLDIDKYYTVDLIKIDEAEYNQLKYSKLHTYDEIVELVLMNLIDKGLL